MEDDRQKEIQKVVPDGIVTHGADLPPKGSDGQQLPPIREKIVRKS